MFYQQSTLTKPATLNGEKGFRIQMYSFSRNHHWLNKCQSTEPLLGHFCLDKGDAPTTLLFLLRLENLISIKLGIY